jgi:hypothetical protein
VGQFRLQKRQSRSDFAANRHTVKNKAVYLALGVRADGTKEIVGI